MAIKDFGLGISPEDLERLFTSFHRVRRAETVSIRGTGLGLYIVKSLVELMGGTITVDTALDLGSVFTVVLPIADDDAVRLPLAS